MTKQEFEEKMKFWEPERIPYISKPTYRQGDFVIIYDDKDWIPNFSLYKGHKRLNEYLWNIPIKDLAELYRFPTHIAICLSGIMGAIKIPGNTGN